MSTLNPAIATLPSTAKASSLMQMTSWYLHRVWEALERHGRRRAAHELLRLADDIAVTQPKAAAEIATQARRWLAA